MVNSMKKYAVKIGELFGRITIIKDLGNTKDWRRMVLYKCSCGNVKKSRFDAIYRGMTKSCGCLHSEVVSELMSNNKKHGDNCRGKTSKEYTAWRGMIMRCENINDPRYKFYGGRGIEVCSQWRNSYQQFLQDMGRKPTLKHSIDRINNNGNYSPDNCRWATPTQQSSNTRRNIFIELNNEVKTLAEWVRVFGINYGTALGRYRKGWNAESIFNIKITC